MNLTDEQWNIIEPLIPVKRRVLDRRGKLRADNRAVLAGILWVLKTGARWQDLPRQYPSKSACHRRFQEWVEQAVLQNILTALAQDMEARGKIDPKECFIDGTFSSAKKGGLPLVLRNAEKAQRSWPFQTRALFLSPSVWPLLLRMKSPWWNARLPRDLPERTRMYSWVTRDTTVIRSMRA
jgi:transposase